MGELFFLLASLVGRGAPTNAEREKKHRVEMTEVIFYYIEEPF